MAELCQLLGVAEARFRSLGDEPTLIRRARTKLATGKISARRRRELWGIFAPTADWDDVIGDVDLGNEIFTLIDLLWSPWGWWR
ncbi:MAG TPA: hypothetical protein VML75_21760 [Kofleriaceae bacterium]|nr:hypothetical protein [Kofleriaceae bacterium]